jgi:RNA polymerase subunit RPABC4/transcription elongation factor Spt4
MEGLPDPGQIWNDFTSNPVTQLAATLIVIYVVMLWLGTAYWAFRDMQARSENPILPYFASALIIFFTPLVFLFAWLMYIIIRPRETMAEGYERSLAEESLLAEMEKHRSCPTCRARVDEAWIVCPNCRTRLHRICPACQRLTEPSWSICAYCGTELPTRARPAATPAPVAAATEDRSDYGREKGAVPQAAHNP